MANASRGIDLLLSSLSFLGVVSVLCVLGGSFVRHKGSCVSTMPVFSRECQCLWRRNMAVNLTPQYLEAEAEYKRAQTAEDRLECLKKMWSLVPKHKASEKLQAELKTKMSELKEEVERERKAPKKAGVSHKIPKQGAGQVILIGGPNGG